LLIPMAAGVELLHTATLVHDDTIDNSLKRRGKPTASNIWGGGIAILSGDYLFAQSAELVARTGNLRVIRLFARTLMDLCCGELEQNFSSFNQNQSRRSYFGRIANKTASLFSTATESAGILSEAPEKAIQSLQKFGHSLGMAFQITDDILDFTADEEKLGKPVGSDLIQGTLTLPTILLKERYPENNPIEDIFDNNGDHKEESLKLAIEMIYNSDIIPECYSIAQGFITEASQAVEELPDNSCRQALVRIADHVVTRQK
jgi:geranylgeranyl pyrophosphate synthase